MTDALLRHYGLSGPSADKWEDIDASQNPQFFKSSEPDALGTGQSVSKVLYDRGVLRVDTGVPAEYSIDSKTFDATAYIRNVHRKATQNELMHGQNHLRQAIDSKAGSLKVLVEKNFDRFVGSKRVIDNVHMQLSSDFRADGTTSSRMDGLRKALTETSIRATQVFEPAIENRQKAERVRAVLGFMEQHSTQFDLPSVLLKCIARNDNEGLLREFKKGQATFNEFNTQAISGDVSSRRNARLLSRVWHEVQNIMRSYEAKIWKVLEGQQYSDYESTTSLANLLLELGVDTNPYHRAYTRHNLRIKENITTLAPENRVQVEILRRQLQIKHVSSLKERLETLSTFAKTTNRSSSTKGTVLQNGDDISFWNSVNSLVHDIWTAPVAGIAENWRVVQDMTNARSVKLLPNGPDGKSRRFHAFTPQERETVVARTEETIDLLCHYLTEFFVSRPMTSLPPSDKSVDSSGDANTAPVLPDLGDKVLPEFSFLPPACNSLIASSQLSTLMSTVMAGVSQLHGLKISPKVEDRLSKMMTAIRERFIRAICELWQADSDDMPLLEVWEPCSNADGSNFPNVFWTIQKAIIEGLSRIMFKNELMPVPSQRLLGNVRQQFTKNVYQVINGLMTASYSAAPSALLSSHTDVEVKKLFTITNLHVIQTSSLQQLIQTIESTFSLSLTPELIKMNDMFSQYSDKLTTSFLSPRLLFVERTIKGDLGNLDWIAVEVPRDNSPWTNQVLLESITTHAKIAAHTPSLLKSSLEAIVAHIFDILATIIRPVQHISKGGMLQVTLDMEFLALQYGSWLPERAKRVLDEIFGIIDARVTGEKVDAKDKADLKQILGRASRRWKVQADVFREPLLAAPTRR